MSKEKKTVSGASIDPFTHWAHKTGRIFMLLFILYTGPEGNTVKWKQSCPCTVIKKFQKIHISKRPVVNIIHSFSIQSLFIVGYCIFIRGSWQLIQ